MTKDHRDELFTAYSRTHIDHVERNVGDRAPWFASYVAAHYAPHLGGHDPATARVLEIGCSRGELLAAFHGRGFRNLVGLDLSPDDAARARLLVPDATIVVHDATDWLTSPGPAFQVVVMKAVLEHTLKGDVLPLLRAIRGRLASPGVVLVEVPNMDWLFAGHERYMDFTHEVGFTRESLGQVLRLVYDDVAVHPIDQTLPVAHRLPRRRRLARWIVEGLLGLCDPQGASPLLWARSILGVARI